MTENAVPGKGILIFAKGADGNYYAVSSDNTGAINITGSISASLEGFAPNGNVATRSVSTSSANVALPAGATVAVSNTGSVAACIKLSVGAGSAATTDFQLQPGATVGWTVGSNTFINAITASGSTSLSIAGGTGLVSGYGGGGGSSSGGDASAANQTAVIGTKAPGTAAASSLLVGGVYTAAGVTLTNGQQCAAQLTAVGALITSSVAAGVIGAATAPASMLVGGGVYNSSPLTLTNGQSSAFQFDANGYLKCVVTSATGVAQGSTSSGQTLSPIGGRTLAASPTDTTAQTNMPVLDLNGAMLVQPYGHNDNGVDGVSSALTNTSAGAVIAAQGANVCMYITTIVVSNSHATQGTDVEILDDTTVRMYIPAASLWGGGVIALPKPLKITANKALNARCVTSGASVRVSAVGYKGP